MSRRRVAIWLLPTVAYVAFFGWYTDFGGPLREDEIEGYLARLEAVGGFDSARRDRIRRFMEEDTGRPFLMLNAIDYADDPPDQPGAPPGASATELMNLYMEHMLAEQLARACHPAVLGEAVFPALDLLGVEVLPDADRWDMGAFFRYRSRRTLLDIITIPETHERHAFKIAALDKTIAYPVEAQLYLGDLRIVLGLLLLAGAALADLFTTPSAAAGR